MSSQAPKSATVIALVVACLVIRGGVLLATPGALADDPDGYRRLAENVVHCGTLGLGRVPSAYRPPLYPLLLAPAVALADLARLAIGGLHLAIGVATVLLVYLLGRRWGLGRWAAVAGVLVACDPILLVQSTLVMTETLAVLMAVGALWWLTAAVERPRASRAVAAGAWLALASLCRPTFLVFLAAAAVVLPALDWSWARRLKTFGAFTVAAAMVLAPWVVRNQVQLGRPVVATTHGGFTLLLGNNPWFYDYLRKGAWGTIWSADDFAADWSARLAHGGPRDELANDRAAYAEAWKTIRRQPDMFLYASVVRIGRLWAPMPHRTTAAEGPPWRWLRYGVGLWYVIEFALAVVGLVGAFGGQRKTEGEIGRGGEGETGKDGGGSPRAASPHLLLPPSQSLSLSPPSWRRTWLWGVLLAVCFTTVHAFYWTNMRMRAPLMPAVAIAAAWGVAATAGRVSRRKSHQ